MLKIKEITAYSEGIQQKERSSLSPLPPQFFKKGSQTVYLYSIMERN